MEFNNEFGHFKSDFARQVAMEEEKVRNLNIWVLRGQHSLRRGTSESVLGSKKGIRTPAGQSSAFSSKLHGHGSVGSLPSLVNNDEGEEIWVTTDKFKDILDQKEKEISEEQRLEEENAELRRRLEMTGRRSSNSSLMEISKHQEVQRDIAKLQAKIVKMEQSSADPVSTRRLVSILETFKSQLMLDFPRDFELRHALPSKPEDLDSSLCTSYRPSVESYSRGRPSMGSYRAACHDIQPRDDLYRHQTSRVGSCLAQLSRMNNEIVLGPTLTSSKYSQDSDTNSEASSMSRGTRSRVVMGAKTVQRARSLQNSKDRSIRAYSSSDLLNKPQVRVEEIISNEEEVFGERTPQPVIRSMQSRSKSCNNVLDYMDATDSGRGTDEASESSHCSRVFDLKNSGNEGEGNKIKLKEESKVHKFFKRLKKLVSKETKDSQGKDQEEIPSVRKMTRSVS